MEDDIIGTESTIRSNHTVNCDLCGRPIKVEAAKRAEVDRGGGGPAESVTICRKCYEAIESGDLPFEAEVNAGLKDSDE